MVPAAESRAAAMSGVLQWSAMVHPPITTSLAVDNVAGTASPRVEM